MPDSFLFFAVVVGVVVVPIVVYVLARLASTAHFNAKEDFLRRITNRWKGDDSNENQDFDEPR